MASMSEYGECISATTAAISALVASSVPGVIVASSSPSAVATGETVVNFFLVRDEFSVYREGGDPTWERVYAARLEYLVAVFPADRQDPGAAAQTVHGRVRAALHGTPVLQVGNSFTVTLRTSSPPATELALLWQASDTPLLHSFVLTASFGLRQAPARRFSVIDDLVPLAATGSVVAFAGSDSEAKRVAAASLADTLGRRLIVVPRGSLAELQRHLVQALAESDSNEALLFIDEADEIFGRRTDVRSAHDRYANAEISYLLARLELRGSLAIVAVEGVGDELADRALATVEFPPRD